MFKLEVIPHVTHGYISLLTHLWSQAVFFLLSFFKTCWKTFKAFV